MSKVFNKTRHKTNKHLAYDILIDGLIQRPTSV